MAAVIGLAACTARAPREAPLLLEDEPLTLSTEPAARAAPEADNSRCHVCHINYAMEELAVSHAKANVGCETCHGASNAHCSDEDNITPPDVIFAKAAIRPACMKCHAELTDSHAPGGATDNKVCTDCHGKHRLAVRTRTWDKETRALIKDDRVRMIRTQD